MSLGFPYVPRGHKVGVRDPAPLCLSKTVTGTFWEEGYKGGRKPGSLIFPGGPYGNCDGFTNYHFKV